MLLPESSTPVTTVSLSNYPSQPQTIMLWLWDGSRLRDRMIDADKLDVVAEVFMGRRSGARQCMR